MRSDLVSESAARYALGRLEREGVIKFRLHHERRPLERHRFEEACVTLDALRASVRRVGALGRDPDRYDGAGFGNVSLRLGPAAVQNGAATMLITGSQTGGLARVFLEHLAVVRRSDDVGQEVWSFGLTEPSSEAMTHSAIYDLDRSIRFVVHGHCPALWRRAAELGVPCTAESVRYGTAEMAAEMRRLYRESRLPSVGVLAMRGHEDGVVAFGHRAAEARDRLLHHLARAEAL